MLPLLQFFSARADVTLPLVLGNNMVLQSGKPVTIWGRANAGEKITVSFKGQTANTVAGADQKWMLVLKPYPASFEPATMTINNITLTNILIGEVWLCSGQSNMEYTMTKSSKYANAKNSKGLDSAALSQEKNQNIRLFLVKRDLTKPAEVNKGWNSAEGSSLGAFAAAGYHFAKELYNNLHVPIGMIASSISGSAIEPWMSGTPTFSEASNTLKIDEEHPGKFYEGMIKPLAPFSIKGFLWYQGETNCFQRESDEYALKFRQLITSWRNLWKDQSTSFYFVEIAPFNYSRSEGKIRLSSTTLPFFREAQASVLNLPRTGMVLTSDLVDHIEDLHPAYKWEIGRRLALQALARDYHKKIIAEGPRLKGSKIIGTTIEIEFFNTGSGLKSSDSKPLNSFFIAGKDGEFIPALAVIKNDKVIVGSTDLKNPKYVRFGWDEAAQPNLFNKEGLPAYPFRTDHFPNTDSLSVHQLANRP